MDYEYIKDSTLISYARRIERARMKLAGCSLTATSISRHANPFVIEIQGDTLIMRKGWREAMKAA